MNAKRRDVAQRANLLRDRVRVFQGFLQRVFEEPVLSHFEADLPIAQRVRTNLGERVATSAAGCAR